jgi:hypothetical protein
MSIVLQFELILKIGSIICAYRGRQKNISWAPRWTGLMYTVRFLLNGGDPGELICNKAESKL